ncbi:MAG: tRNA uridine-5-carboxymethylaminomethyl(34) synthesis GTPase MnmE, partial [Planctomycetota bacterium]
EGALAHLQLAQEWVATGGPQDLVAEELRQALAELAALVGEVTPEDLLDRVFGAFCIGK